MKNIKYNDERRFFCENCGGGFKRKEIIFDTENNDCDLCIDCHPNDIYFRSSFTTREWFNLMKKHEGGNLPEEYCTLFDRDGEVGEEYSDIMNADNYVLK